MVSAVVDVLEKPVTVKIRVGWDSEHKYAVGYIESLDEQIAGQN